VSARVEEVPSMARARVLIGFGEAVPAPEVIFSLLSAGHEVRVFARTGAGRRLRGLPIGQPMEITAPEKDAQAAVEGIGKAVATFRPEVLLALDDPALWLVASAARQGLIEGVVPAHATGAQAAVALDKEAQIAAAQAAGLAVPRTLVVREPDDLRQVADFPAIMKPAMAVVSRDGRIVKGGARYLLSAEDAGRSAATSRIDCPMLVQPLIAGVGEGVFGFATDEGIAAWSGHRRLRMMNPHGSGASACEVNPPDEAIRARISEMMTAIGWRGPFMIELLRDAAGRQWFMELNGRMWGSLALARRNGFEYPAWAVAHALDAGFRPARLEGRGEREVRHLGREVLHLMHVARGPRSDFHRSGWPEFWPAVRTVLKPGRRSSFYNYDPGYPRFFIRDAWSTVRAALRLKH
jgi:hypothetical protein